MRSLFYVAALAATAIFLVPPLGAQGYQVQPMLATLEPAGAGARLTMLIKNTGAVPITLELIPFRATVDEAGDPTRVDEEKDLLVYPVQTAIPPGKEQSVQVRYIGDPALVDARMYGIRVSQLPVDFKQGALAAAGATTDVKVSFNFLSHIIVSPSGAKPVLVVEDAGRGANGDLQLRIVNNGPGIAVMGPSTLKLTDGSGKTVTIKAEGLDVGIFSALMPKQNRRATVASKELAGLVGPVKPLLELK